MRRWIVALLALGFAQPALATSTMLEGQAYVDQCRAAGVPVPERWDVDDWEFLGVVDIRPEPDGTSPTFIFGTRETRTYIKRSESPRGVCIALPRLADSAEPSPPPDEEQFVTTMGLICQGNEASKACFFEITPESLRGMSTGVCQGDVYSADPFCRSLFLKQEVDLADFASGYGLQFHANGICSDCHSGNNIFIVHPHTALDDVGKLLEPDDWVDPIVHPDWPQNQGPTTRLDEVALNTEPGDNDASCLTCHTSFVPELERSVFVSGRFPELSNGVRDYCSTVFRQATNRTMPPLTTERGQGDPTPYQKHIDEAAAACAENPKPRIIYPTEGSPAHAGDRTDPGKIWVLVEPPLRRSYDPDDYTITIGGREATIIAGLEVDRQLWMVVEPAADSATAAGEVDLQVSAVLNNVDPGSRVISVDAATESDAVFFGDPGVPVDLMIVGDISGSMGEFGKLEAAQNAARLFVDHASEGDEIGVAHFETSADTDLTLRPVDDDALRDAKAQINGWSAGGNTALGQGVLEGYDEFVARGNADHQWRMALLSDDLENVDPRWIPEDAGDEPVVKNTVLDSPNKIYIDMVTLGPDASVDLARDVSTSTDGTYYRVSADGVVEPGVLALSTTAGLAPSTPFPNRLAGVYKSMAEDARREVRIGDEVGVVFGPGDARTFAFTLESGLPEVLIAVNWDRPVAEPLELLVGGESCAGPDRERRVDATHVQCRIDEPVPGPVTVTVRRPGIIVPSVAGEGPVDSLPFRLMLSAYSRIALLTPPVRNALDDGGDVRLLVFVGDDADIEGANVTVDLVDASGTTIRVTLFDDGMHGDGEAGDGFYGNEVEGLPPGHYTTDYAADGESNGGVPFDRGRTGTIRVEDTVELTDLKIDSAHASAKRRPFAELELEAIFRASRELDLRDATLTLESLLADAGVEHVEDVPIRLSALPGATRNFAKFASLLFPGVVVKVLHLGGSRYFVDVNFFNTGIESPPGCGFLVGRPVLHTRLVLDDGVGDAVDARTTEPWLCLGGDRLFNF